MYELVLEKNYLKICDLKKILQDTFDIPHSNLEEKDIALNAVGYLSYEFAVKYGVFPLRVEDNDLILAMCDPIDIMVRDNIQAMTSKNLRPFFAEKSRIHNCIQKYYKLEGVVGDMCDDLSSFEILDSSQHKEVDLDHFDTKGSNDAPVVKLVNQIIRDSIRCRASDIHIEPQDAGVQVRYRVDGDLKNIAKLPRKLKNSLVARIKVMSGLDIAEKRKPQDGGIKLNMGDRKVDLRVSIIPIFLGEKIVIRILDPKGTKTQLESLGFSDKDLRIIKGVIQKPQGMVLVTGPTGSGKTSSIYAALNYVKCEEKNIITIEDPVEYLMNGINQIQVNLKAGVTFAKGLRSILRQDPNVILVGEIRDDETAEIALRASMTGHLVFSTLHTNSAIATFARLYDIGMKPYLVASCLSLIIAQRLVRINCPRCSEPYLPSSQLLDRFQNYFEKRPVDVFSKGQGCDHCLGAGYLGRTAVYEFILVTDRIRELIVQKVAEGEILKELKRTGFKTIIENGLEKVAEGITSLEEISNIIEFSDDIHRSVENVLKTNPILLYANTKKSSPMTKLSKKSRIEDLHPQPRRVTQGNLEREIV